jgi:hypothetical protein
LLYASRPPKTAAQFWATCIRLTGDVPLFDQGRNKALVCPPQTLSIRVTEDHRIIARALIHLFAVDVESASPRHVTSQSIHQSQDLL